MKLRILISFLFFSCMLVNYFTYASQLLPSDNLDAFQSIDNNAISSNTISQDCQLAEISLLSKYLRLFDRDHDLTVTEHTALSDKHSVLITPYKIIHDKRHAYQIRSVDIPDAYLDKIFYVVNEYKIDHMLLYAIAEIESRYDPVAISVSSVKKLIQFMSDTAHRFCMKNSDTELFDQRSNLRVSANCLRSFRELFSDNLRLIIAACNADENAVIKCDHVIPPYRETRQYVAKVISRYQYYLMSGLVM